MRSQAGIEEMLTYGILITAIMIVGIALFRSGVFSPKTAIGEIHKQNLGYFFIQDYSYHTGAYQISLGVMKILILKKIKINEQDLEEYKGLKRPSETILVTGNTSSPPPLELKIYYEVDEFEHIGVAKLPEKG